MKAPSRFGQLLLDKLRAVDAAMVAGGSHPIHGRWWQALERFYLSGKRTLTIRKGRQVYASKGVCPRLVVAHMLVTRHVPPGEVRTLAVLSVKRSDALQRLDNVAGVLDVMRIPYTRSGDTLHIPDLQSRVVVLTASYRTAVGDTCDFIWADEMTRWQDDSTSGSNPASNPASHVVGSIKPSLVTLPDAKLFQVSSAWMTDDFHAKQVDRGDDDGQNVEVFATWEASHLTEDDCRKMAADEAEFWREYGAKPSTINGRRYLAPESVAASQARRVPHWFHRRGAPHFCLDASGGHVGGDSFAWAVLGWWQENPLETFQIRKANNANGVEVRISPADGQPIRRLDRPKMDPILCVEYCNKLDAPFHDTWAPSRITKRIVADGSTFGARYAHADQYSEHAYQEHFRNEGVKMFYHNLNVNTKGLACTTMRQWFDAGVIAIADSPGAEALVKELQVFQETMTPGGTMRYSAPSGEHDDLTACILMAALSATSDERTARLGWESARGMLTSDDLTRQQYRKAQ